MRRLDGWLAEIPSIQERVNWKLEIAFTYLKGIIQPVEALPTAAALEPVLPDDPAIAAVVSPSFLNSYVAPMALINAIHVACAHLDPRRSLTKLKPTDKEYLSGARWYREVKSAG